jgi:cytochrome c oxidase subunit 4
LGVSVSVTLSDRAPLMEKVVKPKTYLKTSLALLSLLALTWATAYVDLGPFNLIVALTIAIVKAILIALVFMHMKWSSSLFRLAALAGLMWLLIMIALTLTDYATR